MKRKSTLTMLKQQRTKQLARLVRQVQAARRMSRHVPTAEMLLAAAAKSILTERSKRK